MQLRSLIIGVIVAVIALAIIYAISMPNFSNSKVLPGPGPLKPGTTVSGPRIIGMNAKLIAGRFVPANITIKKGDTLNLKVTAYDKSYSVVEPGTGIETNITAGKIASYTYVSNKTGSLVYICHNSCPSKTYFTVTAE